MSFVRENTNNSTNLSYCHQKLKLPMLLVSPSPGCHSQPACSRPSRICSWQLQPHSFQAFSWMLGSLDYLKPITYFPEPKKFLSLLWYHMPCPALTTLPIVRPWLGRGWCRGREKSWKAITNHPWQEFCNSQIPHRHHHKNSFFQLIPGYQPVTSQIWTCCLQDVNYNTA